MAKAAPAVAVQMMAASAVTRVVRRVRLADLMWASSERGWAANVTQPTQMRKATLTRMCGALNHVLADVLLPGARSGPKMVAWPSGDAGVRSAGSCRLTSLPSIFGLARAPRVHVTRYFARPFKKARNCSHSSAGPEVSRYKRGSSE